MNVNSLSQAILHVLDEKTPKGIDEIAFRTRATPSLIVDILDRLKQANIVKQTDDGYQLNRQEKYTLSEMYK